MAGIDEAAQAFDVEMNPKADPPASYTPPRDETSGKPERLFDNVGELEVDDESPERGGGDDEDPEDLIYGKAGSKQAKGKADTRDAGKNGRTDREGGSPENPDDDEHDGDKESDDDGDAESDEEEEQEADDEESALLGQQVEVTVDGEPKTVSVKEALEGYIRTETFHRRMNQLDEAKKVVRRAAADAVQNYEYSMNLAKKMQAHMDSMIPKEPNWDEEFQKDPVKARDMQRYYEKANAFKKEIEDQMTEAQKKRLESDHAQLAAFAEEEGQKFEAMNRKNWSDPKKKAKDLNSMRKTALASGFTEEELSQVYDSRMLQVLLKASKYDRMMAAKPRPVVRTAGKPIPPGAGSAKQRTARKGLDTAMKRLNRTGSMEDAAMVFDNIIARG